MANNTIQFFPSLTAFLDYVTPDAWGRVRQSAQFMAADNVEQCKDYVRRGATEAEQVQARKLLDKIDTQTHGRKRRAWDNAVSGERVNVGAALAGHPQAMRRRVKVVHERAPLRVFVEVSVSGSVTVEELEKRGAVVAALAVRLAEIRPVQLWACWLSAPRHDDTAPRYGGAVRLETSPLSMATAIAVLAKPQFTRGLRFAALHKMQARSAWDTVYSAYREQNRAQVMRQAFGMEPQDIYVPGGSFDESPEWMRDPVAWVNSYLDPQRDAE